MTQLTDQIRESILGNIGTVISGRIGITDAEILQKKFSPTFDAEDLTKLPNFQTISSVMINNVPSSAFSMSLVPPMGQSNPQLRDALKKLSAAKYGRPRAEIDREIFTRLGAGDAAKKEKMEALKKAQQERMAAMQQSAGGQPGFGMPPGTAPSGNMTAPAAPPSFLDEWLAKRQQITTNKPATAPNPAFGPTVGTPVQPLAPAAESPRKEVSEAPTDTKTAHDEPEKFHIREPKDGDADEMSVKLR
jgi:hypothetical protein